LQLIKKHIKGNHSTVINLALTECVKRKLFSATDFSDVIQYINQQRLRHGTPTDNDRYIEQPSPMSSSWVMNTDAQTREMDEYYSILEGDTR